MTTPNNDYDVVSHSYLHKIDKLDNNVYSVGDAAMMYGGYDPIELTVSDIYHLIKGGALIDLSDGEYIHAFKLSDKAKIEFQKLITIQ